MRLVGVIMIVWVFVCLILAIISSYVNVQNRKSEEDKENTNE